MPSEPCDALHKQGYLFFSPTSTAALKPCLWCKRALAGGDMCYKHQFYGIDSHRCVQMTPTLRCNQRCLFCWRSFEHEMAEEEECLPETILAGVKKLQKKALAGYNAVLDNTVTEETLEGGARATARGDLPLGRAHAVQPAPGTRGPLQRERLHHVRRE